MSPSTSSSSSALDIACPISPFPPSFVTVGASKDTPFLFAKLALFFIARAIPMNFADSLPSSQLRTTERFKSSGLSTTVSSYLIRDASSIEETLSISVFLICTSSANAADNAAL